MSARPEAQSSPPSWHWRRTIVLVGVQHVLRRMLLTDEIDVETLTAPLAPFADALPVPERLVAAHQNGRLTVPIRAGTHCYHRDLPDSAIWGYAGTVPGPTIEAERGQPVTVQWRNELDSALPLVLTTAPRATDSSGVPVQCVPGLSGGTPDQWAAALAGHTVVHLHGGLTPASYDGWTENLFAPGQHAVFHYPMDQRAALLWYHDHVMGVTKFGVYAGLAALWIIRDQRERELDLPEGPPFEVPLLIQDRNFDLDDSGRLTGQLVHKTDPEVMEAFPPFTVVNGKVWPLLEVEAATYRFRVLNGCNARTYRLVLLHENQPELHRITQIGTDHGLLRTPASRRTGLCWRQPSAPTCSSTSPTWRLGASSRCSTQRPPPSPAPPSPPPTLTTP